MPCKVCHTTEVVSVGGIDYCAECSTQVEETRIEVSEAEGTYSWRSSVKTSRSSPGKESKAEKNFYSPWITTDAYNMILWKQVTTLIELGASKNLKDAVLHIWSLYLQKCEVAFRKDYNAVKRTPRLGPVPARRDFKVLYGDKIAKREKIFYKGKQINKKKSSSKTEAIKEISEPEESNVDDISTEHDTEISENESSVSDKSAVERDLKATYSSHARRLMNAKRGKIFKKCRVETQVSQMTLSKTLCFCYLGLIYTEDHLTLSDVIRFVNEGKIPYFNAADCLPSTMKLQCRDFTYFTTHSSPDLYKLSMMCAKLVKFLDLPSFKNRPVLSLVCRYIKDLNLPHDLIPIVKNLLAEFSAKDAKLYEKSPYINSKCFSIPVYENKALAFIIIALKLIFILDGKFEKEHSDIVRKINTLTEDKEYFVWNDWYQHSSVKEYLFLPERNTFPKFRRIDYLSAQEIISNYPITELKPPPDGASTNTRSAAKFSIKDLLFNVGKVTTEKQKVTTSFPLQCQVKHFISKLDSMPAYKDSDRSSFDILLKNFSNTSLDFDISSIDSANDLKSLLFSSLYRPVTTLSVGYTSTSYEEMVLTTSKYWFKNYTQRDSKTAFFDKLPDTFHWLLNFLSRYICTEMGELYFEVVRIEKRLFLGKTKIFE